MGIQRQHTPKGFGGVLAEYLLRPPDADAYDFLLVRVPIVAGHRPGWVMAAIIDNFDATWERLG